MLQKELTKLSTETKELGAEVEQNAANMERLEQSTGTTLAELKNQIEEMKRQESMVIILGCIVIFYQFKIYVANECTNAREEAMFMLFK